ncbi:MAG: uncharacterized protein QOF01_2880 [Thermomicrobiales bacterium]|nr:uncharacterized protein [Thermomicrobiales bacterium]
MSLWALLPETILTFVSLLRDRGVAISSPEVVDALRAIATTPAVLDERVLFEATLAGTLVKRTADLAVFREVFLLYFLEASPDENLHEHGHDHDRSGERGLVGVDVVPRPEGALDAGEERHEHGRRIDLRRFFGEGAERSGHDHHVEDRWRLTWLGSEQIFDRTGGLSHANRSVDGGFGLRRVATAGRPGALRSGNGIELPRDVVLRAEGARRQEQDSERLDEEAVARIGRRMAEVRPLGSSVTGDGRRIARELDPAELRWDDLSSDDLRRLERAVEQMGRRLGGAPGHRRVAKGGRLDGRRTARRAMASGGVPFVPVYLARRDDRPRLVVLCDVSLSVRGAGRFLLQVTRAAQRQSGRVRSFVFVRQLAEVTRLLATNDLEPVLQAIFGGHLLDAAEASDCGAALRAFQQGHGPLLSHKTTLLILGDGRNNGRDPGLDALYGLRRQCRRIVWLSPEGRGTWRLAGCDLPRYATHCNAIESVRTPADLERFVATLAS